LNAIVRSAVMCSSIPGSTSCRVVTGKFLGSNEVIGRCWLLAYVIGNIMAQEMTHRLSRRECVGLALHFQAASPKGRFPGSREKASSQNVDKFELNLVPHGFYKSNQWLTVQLMKLNLDASTINGKNMELNTVK
jgi:hypothetical protein